MIACVRACVVQRRHLSECPTDDCQGCQPRSADHGILCEPCHRRLEMMLHDAPTVDAWLTANLSTLGTVTAKEDFERSKSGATGSPAPMQVGIFDVRQQLRDQLASWVDNLCADQTDLKGPARHTPKADAGYLERLLSRVEAMTWVGDLWDEIGQTMTDAHALAPWRPAMRRRPGIPCPNQDCGMTTLVVFGGEDATTCLTCRWIITPAEYGLWLRSLRYEADQQSA